MVYFVEAWKVKDTWLALSKEERANYMGQVGAHIGSLIEKGVQVLTWSDNNPHTSFKADYDYFAIWTFPNQEMADEFQQLVENAGWYNYFEQENLMGEETSAEDLIGQLIQL